MIEDNLLQIGFNFVHFTENNAALSFNLLLSQNAILDDVGQYLHHPTVNTQTAQYDRYCQSCSHSLSLIKQ